MKLMTIILLLLILVSSNALGYEGLADEVSWEVEDFNCE